MTDTEAIAWAIDKLEACGIGFKNAYSASMLDRLQRVLFVENAAAPTPPAQEDQWQQVVLNECMAIECCYKESDPAGTVKCLIDWHVMNERTPPAQEDEPVGFVGQSMIDGLKAGKRVQNWILPKKNDDPDFCEMNVPLYTRPDNSELRKAAEEVIDSWYANNDGFTDPALENLRAALEGK